MVAVFLSTGEYPVFFSFPGLSFLLRVFTFPRGPKLLIGASILFAFAIY